MHSQSFAIFLTLRFTFVNLYLQTRRTRSSLFTLPAIDHFSTMVVRLAVLGKAIVWHTLRIVLGFCDISYLLRLTSQKKEIRLFFRFLVYLQSNEQDDGDSA